MTPGNAVTRTAAFARDLLAQCFGFTDVVGPVEHHEGSRRFRLAWEAKGGRVPVVVATSAAGGDAFVKAQPEFGDGEGGRLRRSPVALLQDWLNANDHALWGLVFAGERIRLMRDNASLTRPAWIEADLGRIFAEEAPYADFIAIWLLIHATRFGAEGATPSDCPLEQWREEGLKQGIEARADLRRNVEDALTDLGQGLVEANPELVQHLESGVLALNDFFEELLRTIYRSRPHCSSACRARIFSPGLNGLLGRPVPSDQYPRNCPPACQPHCPLGRMHQRCPAT